MGSRHVLLAIYRILIQSWLDYNNIVYGSARNSYIGLLDTVHHQGLRLDLGAFYILSVQSLCVEANELSLYNRRIKQAMQYVVKLKANTIERKKQVHVREEARPNLPNCDVEQCLIPHSDLNPLIATHIKAKCQHEWDESIISTLL